MLFDIDRLAIAQKWIVRKEAIGGSRILLLTGGGRDCLRLLMLVRGLTSKLPNSKSLILFSGNIHRHLLYKQL